MGTEIEAVQRAGPAEMSLSHFQAGSTTSRPTEQGDLREAEKAREAQKRPADQPAQAAQAAQPAQAAPAQGNVGLVFEVSKDGKDLVIKIVDRDHDKVLREIPPEELQHFRSAMRDLVGLLVDRKG